MSVFGIVRATLDDGLMARISARHANDNKQAFFHMLRNMTGVAVCSVDGVSIAEGSWDALQRCHAVLYKYQAELCAEELADLTDPSEDLLTNQKRPSPDSTVTLSQCPNSQESEEDCGTLDLSLKPGRTTPQAPLDRMEEDCMSWRSAESSRDSPDNSVGAEDGSASVPNDLDISVKSEASSLSATNSGWLTPPGGKSPHRRSFLPNRPDQTKMHPCPYCDVTLGSSMNLKKHIQRKHSTPMHKCEICGKAYGFVNDLREHKKIHFLKLPCNQCDKEFKSRRSLLGHLSMTHKDSGIPPPPPPPASLVPDTPSLNPSLYPGVSPFTSYFSAARLDLDSDSPLLHSFGSRVESMCGQNSRTTANQQSMSSTNHISGIPSNQEPDSMSNNLALNLTRTGPMGYSIKNSSLEIPC